ncbi:hypothetical protein BGX38DRAFT_1269494 [Terfezia claveryi]|nr:hypothetical protein BGX38DRAFT_1269494 [Terfezia claveryi]
MPQSKSSLEELLAVDADSTAMRCRFGYYDYIIIGSGFGGGILAEQLVTEKKRVLLIEKGGPLFSTHILNCPRPDYARGEYNSQEGNEIIYSAVKQTIQTAENSDPYVGGPVYCLGGRSNVWGLWIPQAYAATLTEYFPEAVHSELTAGGWYTRAFNLVTNDSQENKIYPEGHIDPEVLQQSVGDLSIALAPFIRPDSKVGIGPIATQLNSSAPYRFPQGAYSTTVSLMNRIYARDEFLTVLMNHECLDFQYPSPEDHLEQPDNPESPRRKVAVTSLTLRSTVDQKLHRIDIPRSDTRVILSAGTLCTPRIAQNSGLQLHNPLVGIGLTDHEVYAVRFAKERIGASASPIYLQCMIDICGTTALLTVTINANYLFSSGGNGATLPIRQYIDKHGNLFSETSGFAKFRQHLDELDTMQILLEYHAELDNNNEVLDIPAPEPAIRVRRRFTHTSESQQEEMQVLATIIREAFRDQPVKEQKPPPAPRMELLGFGVFSHEVGTMRMPSPSNDSSVVDSNLQVNGFQNLFVCDLSVFPVSTEANPTLTLAALSMRLSSYLTQPQTTEVVVG